MKENYLTPYWDGCFAKFGLKYAPFRGTIDIIFSITPVILKIIYDGQLQMYRPIPGCDGKCPFSGAAYCYVNPGNLNNKFKIQIGVDFFFISYSKTIYEKNSEWPECTTPPPVPKMCSKKIVGYYTSWRQKKLSVDQAKLFTHIIYAFMEIKSNGEVIVGVPGKITMYLILKIK